MNRILYFVHYHKYNLLSEYVMYLLRNVRTLYTRIVVISNSPLSETQRNKLSLFCDEIRLRENKGFDFGAWKDALLADGWEKLSQYDNITLMNDTCFGPLFDLESIYVNMEQKEIDFWGLTNYKNDKFGMPGTNGPVPEHIQSYFICFKENVVASNSFKIFWQSIKYENDIIKIIQKYEIRLTQILIKDGFKYSVFLDAISLSNARFDLTFVRPDLCLNFKIPFIKIKSFTFFPHPKYIITFIKEKANYPVSLIFDYLNQVYDPETTLFIQNKLLYSNEKNINVIHKTKVAIHLHSYYPNVLDNYIPFLNNVNIGYDLYITTDSLEKKEIIHNYLKNQACFLKLKEIIITKNQREDLISWLLIKDNLNQYDIVGHFHTKKTSSVDERIGISLLYDILRSLLHNINSIINEFDINDNLGIIIPEVPYIVQKLPPIAFNANLNKTLSSLWKKLKCQKTVDFKNVKKVIFPMGNMFWYRPAALKPLFELQLLPDDINRDSFQEALILNAIEHLLVYIAWNEGYDYRISPPHEDHDSNFISMYKIYDITGSFSYRLSRKILVLPRAIKRFLTHVMV